MSHFGVLSETLDNAERLKNIHYMIEEYKLPIYAKDDLSEQVIEVEKYLGEDQFKKLEAKKNKVNIWTGILALPVLVYCILLLVSKYAHRLGFNFDVNAINHILFSEILHYLWGVIIYAVIFFGMIAYFYRLNKHSKTLMNTVLEKLIMKLNLK